MINKKFECLIDFVFDILGLQFLCHKVSNDGVYPEIQLLDGFLTVFRSGFCTLQSVKENFNLK